MVPFRIVAVMAALAVTSGCVPATTAGGPPAPAAWNRPADQHPWFMSGPTPTASAIENALYQDAYNIDLSECPFYLVTCVRTRGERRTPNFQLEVDEVRCSPVAEWQDQCTFRLTETIADGTSVRSQCSGNFEVVGTSHDPHRWGVDYGEDDAQPAVVCRRGRTERRAVG